MEDQKVDWPKAFDALEKRLPYSVNATQQGELVEGRNNGE